MDLGLQNKVAVVFGASRGIGKAVAQSLATEGAHVGLVARDEAGLQAVAETLSTEHAIAVADCMQPGAAVEAVKNLEDQLGKVAVVVHCIGGGIDERNATSSVEKWQESWQYNVGIAATVNAYIVPKLQTAGWGRVVHVSSVSAEHLRGDALYVANKAALRDYSTVLGREVAQDGVVVTSVLPGAVEFKGNTWFARKSENPELYNDYLGHYCASGRMGTPEEIAGVVTFLCSEQASFMAGAVVPVDGGTT